MARRGHRRRRRGPPARAARRRRALAHRPAVRGGGGTGVGHRLPGPSSGHPLPLPAAGPAQRRRRSPPDLPARPIAPCRRRSSPTSGALWFPPPSRQHVHQLSFSGSQWQDRTAALRDATQWEQREAGLDPICPQLIGWEGAVPGGVMSPAGA